MSNITLRQYQKWCVGIWTCNKGEYTLHDDYVMGMGIPGEVGEVVELLKKAERDEKDVTKVNKKKLTKEIGDVLYYMMILMDRHGIDPEEVMKVNVKKLETRYRRKRR
jgi:NTP pyrophosphatase (non-canonical NTP hydrolase)